MGELRFNYCMSVVREFEGGWSNHRDDPGGATKWGICLRFLRRLGRDVNGDGAIDVDDIRALTEGAVRELYKQEFWKACGAASLPQGLDLAVFDSAVNQGPPTARKMLQKAAGVKADGIVGPQTLAAIDGMSSRDLLRDFQARRALRYCRSPKILVFGFGWFRRLLKVHELAVLSG